MEHEELLDHLELEVPADFEFTPDQAEVMYACHEESGRVCVGSGAGTGKTTTLTRVVAETVVRMTGANPSSLDSNPFDEILVTTFTRDAAGQLKGKIKSVLRDHQQQCGEEFDPALWRWLETESHISTIDSFIGDLLREIATEVGLAPGFDVRDDLETQDLLQEVFRELREDPDYEDAIKFLEREFDSADDPSPRQFIHDIHQKLREFCHEFPPVDSPEGTTMFSDQLRDELHQDLEPPYDAADIREIAAGVTGRPPQDQPEPSDSTIEGIEDDYEHSLEFTQAVETVLDGFNEVYDRETRRTGAVSYQDITYLVWSYLTSEAGESLAESLQKRFSHLFIDEFQDTSFAQCQILQQLISNDDTPTNLMVIGDVKQSIYSWRSADPAIFAHILDHAASDSAEPDEYLRATNWQRAELMSNFRSHPHLVRAGNHLFNQMFADSGRGDIGTFPVDHGPLIPQRPETSPEDAHVHVLPLGECNADAWRQRGPREVAAAIQGMVDDETVTVGDGEDERPARAGDVTLLFRRGKRIGEFRDALDAYGLDSAVIAEEGLFESNEVSFVIDVLDWFANPHSKESLLRILRSPVTALSDRTLRFLASKNLNLGWALDEWPTDRLPASDRERLDALVSLRSDLRWDREGSKASLVRKIIQHTAIESILLAGDDALQRYGNLWMLVEVTRDWEDEELLPYREFVDRLHRYREMAGVGDGSFKVAQTADASATNTVKLRTVHSSKGLEFDIVVLADLLATPGIPPIFMERVAYREPDSRAPQMALRPRPAGGPVDYDGGPGGSWLRLGNPSTLWITDNREQSRGQPNWGHPYNPAWQDDVAEFWRLLYVAFTRAADHIVFPLPNSIPHFYNWKSWAPLLNDVFQPGDSWTQTENGTLIEFKVDSGAQHGDDSDRHSVIPLGVGTLPSGEPVEPNPLDLTDIPVNDEVAEEDGGAEEGDQPVYENIFTPRELKPSTLYDLSACPRRYQYRALQNVSESRGESPTGTNAPSDISPSYWGTLVHDALEHLHLDLRNGTLDQAESQLAAYLDSLDEGADEVEVLVDRYRNTDTWEEVSTAVSVLPEYELSAMHPADPQVHLSGFVDLLYETEAGWVIADYKTGSVPASDSYLKDQYHRQLTTYAWMLNAEYDIEPAAARLIYVQNGDEHDISIDWNAFEDYLRSLPENLTIETGEGLPVDPDPDPASNEAESLSLESRCGSCPYTSICPAWTD